MKATYIIGLVSAVVVFLVMLWLTSTENSVLVDNSPDCQTQISTKTVRGNSMTPLLAAGTEVQAIANYYACQTPQRNEVALVMYAGNEAPLIKMIRGIPGDSFDFQEYAGLYHLLLNGDILTNSSGEAYTFSRMNIQEIAKYGEAYGYTIPAERYLVLGEAVSGSLDSTRFGFVSRNLLVAKVALE
jgi:signal peptidase I